MDPSNSPGDLGADPLILENDGKQFAYLAVENDKAGRYDTAMFYYNEAAQALLSAALAGSTMSGIITHANEYILRAEALRSNLQAAPVNQGQKSQEKMDLERATFLLHQAFDEDEAGNETEARELYTESCDLFLNIRKAAMERKDKTLTDKVTVLATKALDRAEELKKKQEGPAKSPKPVQTPQNDGRGIPPLGYGAFLDDENERGTPQATRQNVRPQGQSSTGLVNVGPSGYTKEEIATIRKTSFINSREYVPFMSVDMKERFAYPMPFEDKHGKLSLSPKQKKNLSGWVRPEDFQDDPKLILAVSCFSIKQTVVSDCSFVASLAISAQYERRFKKKLITSIIYPQNRQGQPVYNPCGKYMIKLHINGVQRKVVIDDFLPMGRDGQLLCSFSNNKNELWVSLLEKAYMKVMGGYDFPGSNSSIDLHALTGWIPERLALRKKSKEFDRDREFRRILDRFHKGHCLITVATGELSEVEADRAGLVPTHAYAMLDIREEMGKRLFMLKNPWSHLRWKGNFSEVDMANWTPQLQKLLNYDPKSAQTYDNGVFWIDYDSLLHFFDVIYLNWSPELFKYTHCVHSTWAAKEGPKKDSYNISDNPQYRLEIKTAQPAAIWILLTRHITDKDDFADNKEFITLLVYKTGGKKVFYPYSPPPYKDGVRINTPHYLCKMVEERGSTSYTLVVSQYEKNNTIHYSLRVYASCEFTMTKILDPYQKQFDKRINGQWKGRSAGGCSNYSDTHGLNPIYQVQLDNSTTDNYIMIELLGPKQYSVGFEVRSVSENVPGAPGTFTKTTSGDFRPGYCVLQLDKLSGGVYNIQPCTFLPNQEGPFFLDISSAKHFNVAQIQ
ncbi:calpain-7-like isoform X1 [Ylistrum balloti]|uniref:calpain-7-like isoform X1 n=1 Tax=Ylistrum balloti TaxID=509963 RepID=UPI002905C548|nr:calpain-7-like isoform X1 [Ylistrum balloti]